MSLVSRAFNGRRRVAVIVPLAALAFGATSAFAAKASAQSADLATTISASQPNPIVGSNESFTITVTNNGPDTAQSVAVNDHWTNFSTFVAVSVTAPSGARCTAPPVGSRGTVTCTTASLARSASITLVLTLRVEGFTNQLLQDTATATSTTSDPNSANNTATIALRII
jgi:uncharacterized repeat protein (TIGR01451 family)